MRKTPPASTIGASMLKNLSPLLSPDLLHALASMGHGDEIVIVDAHFPATTHARRLIQMPGLPADAVLDAVLSVLPLDDYLANATFTMQVVGNADAVPEAVADFRSTLARHGAPAPAALTRQVFYERAARAFAIVQTGETRTYGNIVLAKGVVT